MHGNRRRFDALPFGQIPVASTKKYSTPLVCCIFLLFRRCDGVRGTSYPLSKALVMPCRDEMSKRINFAFAVTERKENRTLREKSHFARAKCFTLRHLGNAILTAKQTIDNRLAGRAAKGENPLLCATKKICHFRAYLFCFPYPFLIAFYV